MHPGRERLTHHWGYSEMRPIPGYRSVFLPLGKMYGILGVSVRFSATLKEGDRVCLYLA